MHCSNKKSYILWLILVLLNTGCQTAPESFFDTGVDAGSIVRHQFKLQANQDMVGKLAYLKSHENDTLPDIARHFGLGYNELTIANSTVDPWLPEAGSQIILPLRFILPDSKRQGLVLNLASMRLFYYPQGQEQVISYPIGIGRKGWSTPTGITRIIAKKQNPEWRVPISIQQEHAQKGDPLPAIIAAGPDNPLGAHALYLSIPSYLIHGTNKPYGVGMQISHGCIRLYPEDIATLFQQVPVGTKVQIIDQPYLLGWDADMLFLEAHAPLNNQHANARKKLLKKLRRLSKQHQVSIDWEKVDDILTQASGIPVPILENSIGLSSILNSAIAVAHPLTFYQQPEIKPLNENDWSITVTSFDDPESAQKLVAMLNHQSPIIPARKIRHSNQFKVIAGPFENRKKVDEVIGKIQQEFELNGIAHPPGTQNYSTLFDWL